ncbi:hypothetical protein SLEP1_g24645 [Rubroshorea leprosula]|uniref:DUF7722 domain-containing protein n=1 Tax=Rubroshorea leprosula TaxID=152421 RepID=A0AAV5JGB8_9ROSI|nr:hypothetical protein SLEP1_g24645 [Rubroshorea leprosula]
MLIRLSLKGVFLPYLCLQLEFYNNCTFQIPIGHELQHCSLVSVYVHLNPIASFNGHGDISKSSKVSDSMDAYPSGFQMPLHYLRCTKGDYERIEGWKVDLLLRQYVLNFKGTLDEKRAFAMGAFLWPDYKIITASGEVEVYIDHNDMGPNSVEKLLGDAHGVGEVYNGSINGVDIGNITQDIFENLDQGEKTVTADEYSRDFEEEHSNDEEGDESDVDEEYMASPVGSDREDEEYVTPAVEENRMCRNPAKPGAKMVSQLYRAGSPDNLATRALCLTKH